MDKWYAMYKYKGWKPIFWEEPQSDRIVPVTPPEGYYISEVEYKEGKLHSVTYDPIRSLWYRIKHKIKSGVAERIRSVT